MKALAKGSLRFVGRAFGALDRFVTGMSRWLAKPMVVAGSVAMGTTLAVGLMSLLAALVGFDVAFWLTLPVDAFVILPATIVAADRALNGVDLAADEDAKWDALRAEQDAKRAAAKGGA